MPMYDAQNTTAIKSRCLEDEVAGLEVRSVGHENDLEIRHAIAVHITLDDGVFANALRAKLAGRS